MVLLVVSKNLEMRNGKTSLLGGLGAFSDPLIQRVILICRYLILKLKSISFKDFFTARIQNLFQIFGTIGLFVSKYYDKLKSRARGRKVLKGKGVVSFFLKDVAESKEEERKDL